MNSPDRIDQSGITPPVQPDAPAKTNRPGQTEDGKSFGDILRKKVADQVPARTVDSAGESSTVAEPTVKWSAHATARLHQRGIEVGAEEQARVESAIDRAAAKGSREAVVMMDDVAMVASVTNRTIITAIAQDQARENVFTNIDSVVFA